MLAFDCRSAIVLGVRLAVLKQHVDVIDLQTRELLEWTLNVQQQPAKAGEILPRALLGQIQRPSMIIITHKVSPSPSSNL